MPLRILLFLLSAILAVSAATAQQTEIYRDSDRLYFESKEWMEHDQFEASREGFSTYLSQHKQPQSEYYVNATYYQAFVAIQLFHKDAEFLMEDFIRTYPESVWVQKAILDLGRYNFNRRDYDDALYWLKQVSLRDLTAEEQLEVKFKIGLSAFELEQYDVAKKSFFELKDANSDYKAPANYYYGHIAYAEGNYQTALTSFQIAGQDENFSGVVPYYISQIYHYQERYDELIAYAQPLLDTADAVRGDEIAQILGNAYYQKGQFAESLPYLKRYIDRNPNAAAGEQYQLAYAYYRSREYKLSLDYFNKAAQSTNDTLVQVATYQMADAYLKLGEKNYAQNAFKVASQSTIDREITEDALFNYAKLAYELSYDPFHEAIKAFENYLKVYPNTTRKNESYLFLLDVYLATKNYDAALDALDKLSNLDAINKGRYQSAAFNSGAEAFGKGDLEKALRLFERSKKYNIDPKTTALTAYWTGEVQYAKGDYDTAAQSYRQFASNSSAFQTPYFNTVQYNIGYCTFKASNYSESLAAFRNYVGAANTDPKRKSDAYLRIGDLNLVVKNYDQAVEAYGKAITANSGNSDYAIFQMAQAQGYQKNYGAKIKSLNELFAKYPQTTLAAKAYYELGDSYFSNNQIDLALNPFNKVIDEYGESPYRKKALLKRGLIQYRKNQYQEAIASFKTVVKDYGVDSESNEAVVTLASIYSELGKVDEYSAWAASIPGFSVSNLALDSLTYQSAENALANSDCEKALPLFSTYLQKYNTGAFAVNANYYVGECAYRRNDYPLALTAFEKVTEAPVGQFTEAALLGAATIRFRNKEYAKAKSHYERLIAVASFATNIAEGQIGLMRCAYETGNYTTAMNSAKEVLGSQNIPEGITLEAMLIEAKITMHNGDLAKARQLFTALSAKKGTKEGAESKYRIAEIDFKENKLDAAEDGIFELLQQFTSYDYWKIKGFLLLSDVYVAREDYFQARATLQTVRDNVKDQDLLNEARNRLLKIDQLENPATAPKSSVLPSDTLDYENDYRKLIDQPTDNK